MEGKEYWFSIHQFQYRTWVPQAREGAILINIPQTNKYYLYGGVAMEPLNGIARLTVFSKTDCTWEIITPQIKTKTKTLKGRYGFQGTFYDSKFFFFFGCQIYDKMRLERTCLNEIVIFDPYTNEIKIKFPHHVPERNMIPRKYFGGFML